MQTALYHNNQRFVENEYTKEKDFESLLFANAKTLFGQSSILIDAKNKIDNQVLGGTIPDGFLFDLKDPENPEFYLIEVELARHGFYNHIFPQITKFFAFFNNAESQNDLIEKLYTIVNSDDGLRKSFMSKIGKKELFKFIKDTVENSQNILLILDKDKKELPEIINTYTDTWGKMVKLTLFKEYVCEDKSILSLTPEFENIDTVDLSSLEPDQSKPTVYSEGYHLEGVTEEIVSIYNAIQQELYDKIKGLKYNPQRYYISLRKKRNFAYFDIRKKKINLVAMKELSEIEKRIKNHKVFPLADSVQKFYNGPCAQITIEKNKNLDEIINLLVEIQK